MATAQDIVNLAVGDYLSEFQAEQRNLSAYHAERGLEQLNALLAEFPSRGVGGGWKDFYTAADVDVQEPLRVYAQGGSFTVTLPEYPEEGLSVDILNPGTVTVNPRNFTIAGAGGSVSVTTDKKYFFIEGDWKERADMTLQSTVPYPDEFKKAIAALLAMELTGTGGFRDLAPSVVKMAKEGLRRMQSRYRPRLIKRAGTGIDPRKRRINLLTVDY